MAEPNLRGVAAPGYELMISVLARNWWAIGIRGVLAILFGLVALFLPGATMLSLVLLFAAYIFVDGVFGIVSAVRAARTRTLGSPRARRPLSTLPSPLLPCCGRELPWLLSCSWWPFGRSSPAFWSWRRPFGLSLSTAAAG